MTGERPWTRLDTVTMTEIGHHRTGPQNVSAPHLPVPDPSTPHDRSPTGGTAGGQPADRGGGRLVGVDATRGLAALGMIVAHVTSFGVTGSGLGGVVRGLAEGWSVMGFAVLPMAAGSDPALDDLVTLLATRSGLGTAGTVTPARLLGDAPHTGTGVEIVGSAGVVVALAAGLALADRTPPTTTPSQDGATLLAVGAMAAATAYAGPIVGSALLGGFANDWLLPPWPAPWGFVVGAAGLALAWRLVGRGPVEWVSHTLSTRAGRGRVG